MITVTGYLAACAAVAVIAVGECNSDTIEALS
jgi:hypothetical protein